MNSGISKIVFCSAALVLIGCKEKRPDTVVPEPVEPVFTTEQSIEMSQNFAKDESFKIDQFVKRFNWPAITSGTGVRYYIFEKGDGRQAERGTVVTLDYEVRLLDADTTLCYTSQGSEPTSFLVEMDNVESGLHEAITYLKEGDKAWVILPYYLAHGLLGDDDKIPPLSPVLYRIELLHVADA